MKEMKITVQLSIDEIEMLDQLAYQSRDYHFNDIPPDKDRHTAWAMRQAVLRLNQQIQKTVQSETAEWV